MADHIRARRRRRGGEAPHQLYGVQVGDTRGLARPVVVPDAEPRLGVARIALLREPGVGDQAVDVAVRVRQLLRQQAQVRGALRLRHRCGGPADLGDLDRHRRPGHLVERLAELGEPHVGVGQRLLVGVEANAVDVPGEVGPVRVHALDELDLIGHVGLAERQPAHHHRGLGIDSLDRSARGHIEVGIRLGRRVLWVHERGGVLLVPDLVVGHRQLRKPRVRCPEGAAASVATCERRGKGGEVAHVCRRHHRVAVAGDHARPARGVGHDRIPAQPLLGHGLHHRVVLRPVVAVAASARRPRLDVGPARVDARELQAAVRHRRELGCPGRGRPVEYLLHVDAVEAVQACGVCGARTRTSRQAKERSREGEPAEVWRAAARIRPRNHTSLLTTRRRFQTQLPPIAEPFTSNRY